MRKLRQLYGAELIKEVPAVKEFVRRPKMVFPIPSLKMQIVTMYQRPDFKELLQKWINWGNELGLYTNIYDGEVWKTFPFSLENLETFQFFTNDMADSHLGIMINLDWFQSFDSLVYSTGAIYEVICNLPCKVKFKRKIYYISDFYQD